MRKELHPLFIHLGMANLPSQGVAAYSGQLRPSISHSDAVKMVRGIQMYQSHNFAQPRLPLETIWQKGEVRLLKPKTHAAQKNPIILVPSLINKSYILDLSPQCSLLRWLNENNRQAYLLDWGDFKTEDREINIETLIEHRLKSAIEHLSSLHKTKIDALGYCMGGTLLLAHHKRFSSNINKLILLAAPWDFQEKSSTLGKNVRIWSPFVLPVIQEKNHLPAEWVQALFASLDPNGSAKKFIKFAEMDQESPEAELFVSVEDWLNDGTNIPQKIAQHCIQEWFAKNTLVNMNAQAKISTLILASHGDKLVPFKCASAAKNAIKEECLTIIESNTGHIGLIAGKQAQQKVWIPMMEWLKS